MTEVAVAEPVEDQRRRCSRGARCRYADDKHRGRFSDDPFCRACVQALTFALRDALAHLQALHHVIARQIGGGASGDVVSGSRAPPAPVDVGVMALAEDLVFILATWDRIVRDRMQLTSPAYTTPDPGPRDGDHWQRVSSQLRFVDGGHAFRARQDVVVDLASTTLGAHVDALLDAPEHAFRVADDCDQFDVYEQRHTRRGRYVVMAGTDAAGWLIDLGGRVRSRLGLTRLTHRLSYPCPACDVASLERADGSDVVQCQACTKSWTLDDFDVFVKAWGKIRRGDTRADNGRADARPAAHVAGGG